MGTLICPKQRIVENSWTLVAKAFVETTEANTSCACQTMFISVPAQCSWFSHKSITESSGALSTANLWLWLKVTHPIRGEALFRLEVHPPKMWGPKAITILFVWYEGVTMAVLRVQSWLCALQEALQWSRYYMWLPEIQIRVKVKATTCRTFHTQKSISKCKVALSPLLQYCRSHAPVSCTFPYWVGWGISDWAIFRLYRNGS